ncbi:MAG: omptin family outer membrane protease [Thermodesulfovibrionales bacterium]|nr:omptin family outer membrane protease [Thermodesulfovibrionales bacterium]
MLSGIKKVKVSPLHLSLFLLILIVSIPSLSYSAPYGKGELVTEFGAEISYISGYTLYHISYYEGLSGAESELEFPLKTYMLGLQAAILYREKEQDRFKLNFELLKNLDNGSGKLKDSDWLTDDIDIYLYGVAHPGKDIYSESDIELDALVFDINMLYNLYGSDNFSAGPLIGYRYQNFKFIASNVNQKGYGPYSRDFTGFFPGEALQYEIKYNFFYAGINSEFSVNPFKAGLRAGAGYVLAEDRDDHLLRYKLAEAKTDGIGGFINLIADYFITGTLLLKAQGEYLRFQTTGTQHQYFYRPTDECPGGGCDAYVSDRIESEQWNLSLSLIYHFR